MPKKCPKCGGYSVDYDYDLKIWKCYWNNCTFKTKNIEKINEVII